MLLLGSVPGVASSPAPAASGDIALLFTDLTSGPNTGSGTYADGCFVSLFGVGFGATQGSGGVTLNGTDCTIELWGADNSKYGAGLDMIVVQPNGGTTGDFVVTNNAGDVSNGVAFTVDNNRNIREIADESALATALSAIDGDNQDDILYLRAGTYSDETGDTGWGDDTINLGQEWAGIAIIGYPGETVTLDSSGNATGAIRSGNNTGPCDGLTVANLSLNATEYCFRPAGPTDTPDDDIRLVNLDMTTTYDDLNTMTGVISGGGDNFTALAIFMHDVGGTPIYNNNHGIYIQENYLGGTRTAPTNCNIDWIKCENLRMGDVVQFHGDTATLDGSNLHVGNIAILPGASGDCRGILADNIGAADIWIRNYVSYQNGDTQDFTGAIRNVDEADIVATHCTLIEYGSNANTPSLVRLAFTTTGTIEVRNSILLSESGTPYFSATNGSNASQFTADSNVYSGNGTGPGSGITDSNAINADPLLEDPANDDFRPSLESPARDAARASTTDFTNPSHDYDLDGGDRDQEVRPDCGAYEVTGASQSVQTAGTIDSDTDRITIPIGSGEGADIGATDFTIEMWLLASTNNTDSGAAFFNGNIFFDKDHLGQNTSLVLSIHAGVPQIYMRESGSTSLENASTDIRGSSWVFLAMTWDSSSGATQLYVNDTREINATMQSGDLSFPASANAKNQVIELGGEKHMQGTPAFEGSYSEMRFSNTIRYSGASITVPTTKLGIDANTVAYWDFSEGAGTTVFDRDTGDSNMTVQSAATWSTSGPL